MSRSPSKIRNQRTFRTKRERQAMAFAPAVTPFRNLRALTSAAISQLTKISCFFGLVHAYASSGDTPVLAAA
jgi:hypothetical protein